MKLIKSFTAIVAIAALMLGTSAAFAASCCAKAKAEGKDCTHPCCVAAHKEKKTCDKCQNKDSCCDKAIAEGKTCSHPCCVEATKEKKVCEKCNPAKK